MNCQLIWVEPGVGFDAALVVPGFFEQTADMFLWRCTYMCIYINRYGHRLYIYIYIYYIILYYIILYYVILYYIMHEHMYVQPKHSPLQVSTNRQVKVGLMISSRSLSPL